MKRLRKGFQRDDFDDEGLAGRRDEKDRYSKYRNSIYEYEEDDVGDDEDYQYDDYGNEFDD